MSTECSRQHGATRWWPSSLLGQDTWSHLPAQGPTQRGGQKAKPLPKGFLQSWGPWLGEGVAQARRLAWWVEGPGHHGIALRTILAEKRARAWIKVSYSGKQGC